MRLPHHLRAGTLVTLDGPDDRTAELAFDKIWRAAHGLGHGSTPLFDELPMFFELRGSSAERLSSWRDEAVPVLAGGRSAFVLRAPASIEIDGWHVVRFCAAGNSSMVMNSRDAVVLRGHVGDVIEGLFLDLIRQGCYAASAFGARP